MAPSILLVLVAAASTLSLVGLYIGFLKLVGDAFLILIYLGPLLGAAALGSSLAIRFLARRSRGRTSLSIASGLFGTAFVLLLLNGWEYHRIRTGASYCTMCIQFFILPLLAILAAAGGLASEIAGLWRWWADLKGPHGTNPNPPTRL